MTPQTRGSPAYQKRGFAWFIKGTKSNSVNGLNKGRAIYHDHELDQQASR